MPQHFRDESENCGEKFHPLAILNMQTLRSYYNLQNDHMDFKISLISKIQEIFSEGLAIAI